MPLPIEGSQDGCYQDAEAGQLLSNHHHKHDRQSQFHHQQHDGHHVLQRTSSLPHPEPRLHDLPPGSFIPTSPVLRRTTSTHRVPGHEAKAKVKQFISHKRSSSADRGHHASSFTQGQWARAAAQSQYRQRGRFVQLPAHMGNSEEDGEVAMLPAEGQRGRITVFTVCDAFEQRTVMKAIQRKHTSTTCSSCSEVVLVQGLPSYQPGLDRGDLFIFDYGVVVCWGLSAAQELSVLSTLRPCQVKPLKPEDIHKEELGFQYTSDQLPNIQNDVITISRLKALDQQVKLAISHALAQSSKLSVYETRVADLVELVRHLPESMMEHGEIKMPRKQMARLMGRVFIQKSEVNLLSSVLDTPEFFWRAPDALQALYGTVGEYLELEDRAHLVNNRTVLIQSMLNMWSDHANHHHVARLDRIIIILIVVEVAIAFAQIVGFFNY